MPISRPSVVLTTPIALNFYPNSMIPQRSLSNVLKILREDCNLANTLSWNSWSQRLYQLQPIPDVERYESETTYPVPWTDRTTSFLTAYIETKWMLTPSKSMVEDALSMYGEEQKFNPLTDYLTRCANDWDGTQRSEFWLLDYFGCEDTLVAHAISKAWLISAVARAFMPGCQADHCLVLEGKQGLKKSTALRILAGNDYFTESSAQSLADKDAAIQLKGKWIVEFSELAGLKTNAIEEVKSFLTRRIDNYRPPYGKHTIDALRSCVFAGTTNETSYLLDSTGNRRWWPVWCTRANVDELAAIRNDLWGEAVSLYHAGEQWHLTRDEEKLADSIQRARVEQDPWTGVIANYIDNAVANGQDVSVNEVLTAKFKMEYKDINRTHQQRVIQIIRLKGLIEHRKAHGHFWRMPPSGGRKGSLLSS